MDVRRDVVTSASATALPSTWRIVFVLALAVSGLAWDLWTKHEVFAQMGVHNVHPIWNGQLLGVSVKFRFETTLNPGALWGMGAGKAWIFIPLSFVAISAISYCLWKRYAIANWWLTIATGLLLAGTSGNLYDRLGLHGLKDPRTGNPHVVRDFLDFLFFNDAFHWATFNFADTYLVVGACILALHSFLIPADVQSPKPAEIKS